MVHRVIKSLGIIYYINGNRYEGMWSNNEKSGKGNFYFKALGTLYYNNGDKYNGQWANGEKNGEGKEIFKQT